MSILQSLWAKFKRTANTPQTSGAVHSTDFYYELTQASAAPDVIDFGVLPGNARIVDAILWTEGDFTGSNITIGFLAGTLGDNVSARALTPDLFTALAGAGLIAAPARLAQAPVFNSVINVNDQSIGLQFSAAQVVTPGKKLHLRLFYQQ